jgi:hypothetical protein
MKLKLYCADIQIPSNVDHVGLLDPFWGFRRWDPTGEIESISRPYRVEASQMFDIVSSIEQAEAGLIPLDWNHVLNDNDKLSKARRFIEIMDENGKKTFIFFITGARCSSSGQEMSLFFEVRCIGGCDSHVNSLSLNGAETTLDKISAARFT